MREIYFNSDITPKAVNEIKLLTLYYDKIKVIDDAVYTPNIEKNTGKVTVEELQFISLSFQEDYKLLIDEKIIEVIRKDKKDEDRYEKRFAEEISTLVNSNHDLIFPIRNNGRIITEEVYDILKSTRGFDWDNGKPLDTNFIWWYYAFKLKWSLKLLIEGKTCLTSSSNLNELFSIFIKESNKANKKLGIEKGYTKSLAVDALKISLPNPEKLSFDDVLELKLQLKDELELFRQTINSIEVKNKPLLSGDIKKEEYQKVFFDEIQKPLNELKLKMNSLNSKTFREFVGELKNPLSYAPLLGTVIAGLPIEYTFMASMGLTACTSYMKYQEEKNEVRNNGLYFLLKIK